MELEAPVQEFRTEVRLGIMQDYQGIGQSDKGREDRHTGHLKSAFSAMATGTVVGRGCS